MNRKELNSYIQNNYNAKADYPWIKYPEFQVFRHTTNKKWFALVMVVAKSRLGLSEAGCLDVVNLKCTPELIGSLITEKGIFPAYHMNKDNWITLALDDSLSDEKVKLLLDISYNLTKPKARKNALR